MSTAHVTDELPRLLTGEAGREVVLAAAAHLRGCVDCQHELVSAVVAHASLTSAQRFAPELLARGNLIIAPATVDASDDAADGVVETTGPASDAPVALPDLSQVFAQVRREAAEAEGGSPETAPTDTARFRTGAGASTGSTGATASTPAHTGGRGATRSRRLALVAAAVVAVGVGGGVVKAATSGSNQPASRTVALAAFDRGTSPATAQLSTDGGVAIDARQLPTMAGKRYEVWLTNASRTAMQPIGWIGADGSARLRVPEALMQRFSDIEVSVQSLDAGSYNYSGTSVLRGAYRS